MTDRRPRPVARRTLILAPLPVAAALLVACGSDAPDLPGLSATGERGRAAASRFGCAACHGASGEGGPNGTGSAFVGLYGSTVTLDDGTTVVADEAYLTESIVDPHAKQVAGYPQLMPEVALTEQDVAAIVQYIVELATPAATEAP